MTVNCLYLSFYEVGGSLMFLQLFHCFTMQLAKTLPKKLGEHTNNTMSLKKYRHLLMRRSRITLDKKLWASHKSDL